MEEVYVLTIHDEDTFQIIGIYSDYLKVDKDKQLELLKQIIHDFINNL